MPFDVVLSSKTNFTSRAFKWHRSSMSSNMVLNISCPIRCIWAIWAFMVLFKVGWHAIKVFAFFSNQEQTFVQKWGVKKSSCKKFEIINSFVFNKIFWSSRLILRVQCQFHNRVDQLRLKSELIVWHLLRKWHKIFFAISIKIFTVKRRFYFESRKHMEQ